MGWLKGWRNRQRIDVTSDNTSAVKDYQVDYNFNTKSAITWGEMNSDGSDVRFTEADGTTRYPHYFIPDEIGNTDTTLYYNIGTLPTSGNTKTTYFYYGNPNASDKSNASETSFFFSGTESDFPDWSEKKQGEGDKDVYGSTDWFTEGTKSYYLNIDEMLSKDPGQIEFYQQIGDLREIIVDHLMETYMYVDGTATFSIGWPALSSDWIFNDPPEVIWSDEFDLSWPWHGKHWAREITDHRLDLSSAPNGTLVTGLSIHSTPSDSSWAKHFFDNFRGFKYSPQGQTLNASPPTIYGEIGRISEGWDKKSAFTEGTFHNTSAVSDHIKFPGSSDNTALTGTWLSEWREESLPKKWAFGEVLNHMESTESARDEIRLEIRTTNDTPCTDPEHVQSASFYPSDTERKDIRVQDGTYVSCLVSFKRHNDLHTVSIDTINLFSQREVDLIVDEAPSSLESHNEITFKGRVLDQATGDGIEVGTVTGKRISGSTVATFGNCKPDGSGSWTLPYKPVSGAELGTWTIRFYYEEEGI